MVNVKNILQKFYLFSKLSFSISLLFILILLPKFSTSLEDALPLLTKKLQCLYVGDLK